MLEVKHLTLFKPKNLKKGGKFDQGCKKKARFWLQPIVAF